MLAKAAAFSLVRTGGSAAATTAGGGKLAAGAAALVAVAGAAAASAAPSTAQKPPHHSYYSYSFPPSLPCSASSYVRPLRAANAEAATTDAAPRAEDAKSGGGGGGVGAPSSSSLVVPALEASVRALRLVRTVAVIVLDYERHRHEVTFERMGDVGAAFKRGLVMEPATPADHGQDEERRRWEEEVESRTLALERAQLVYTGDGSEGAVYETDERGGGVSWKEKSVEEKREAVQVAARRLSEAESVLTRLGDRKSAVHRRAARRLLDLCRANGGVYVKVGQHLANLDYIIPREYVEELSALFDDAPLTPYEDVRAVIVEETGKPPEEIFDSFETEPIASASLAQVHVARERGTGRKLAVKVQHRGLRETCRGDVAALTVAVRALEWAFPEDFGFGWIVDEIAPNLPRELDFRNEGTNSELAARHIREAGIACVVPRVHWDLTSSRCLCMDFEEGFKSTDLDAIKKAGLNKRDVAFLISSVFNAQVFQSGFVHCDPHPANVLLRARGGKPELVLVDHGLYKKIDDEFRVEYARLWTALMVADIPGIKDACHRLNVDGMYPLLAAMLTSRPFDEIMERSKSGPLGLSKSTDKDKASDMAMIRGYAQRFITDIFDILDAVPRQMLLLFKMNDCLRHIDHTLGSPTNTLVVAGRYAAEAVHEEAVRGRPSQLVRFRSFCDYARIIFWIQLHDVVTWWKDRFSSPSISLLTL